ncbi:MAG: DUF3015 family protein [Myxococcaceae bacterium]
MRRPTTRLFALLLVLPLASGFSACVTVGAQAAGSSNSSGDSSNSSAQSGEGSAASGRSSEQSGQSSNSSGQSSENSSQNSTGEASANSSQGNGQSTLIVSGSGTLLVTVGGIAATIFGIKASADRRAKRAQVALMYLRANSDQLKQDLALGAGPTLDDLAGAAQVRVEHRGRFAQVMQRNRRDLLSLSHVGQLTAERAVQFLEKVGTLVRADPLLREDYERWAAELDG